MAKRYFEFKDAKSHKFWEVSVSAKKVNIRYGKVGTDGQTSVKELDTPAEAKAHADKQAAGKVKKGYKEAKVKAVKKTAKKAVKKKAVKKKVVKKVSKKEVKKNITIDLKGPNESIELRFTHEACSYYEDENENITEVVLETHYKGKVGDTWQDVTQDAADCWDWNDESVINFEAKSELSETSRDFKKMEFLNRKGKWQLVPEVVEDWFHEAEGKSMGF
jgi:predicted DNA-binding WGR domain protein